MTAPSSDADDDQPAPPLIRDRLPALTATGVIVGQLIVLAGFVLVHVVGERLHVLHGVPRSRWLSFAGGVSVAYVFIHILPELAEAADTLGEGSVLLPWLERHAYLAALLGLGIFYALERIIRGEQRRGGRDGSSAASSSTVPIELFWLHMLSFAAYNLLIGYLLAQRTDDGPLGLLFFGLAIGFHFVVNDHGLREDHREAYDRMGRWLLAAALVGGWTLGLVTAVDEGVVAVAFAFLAGALVLNVLKEELPDQRESRLLPFLAGGLGYAMLLLLV